MERPARALIPSQRARVYDELELVVSFAMSIAPYAERESACLWSDQLLLGRKVVRVEEGRETVLALAHDPDRADHPARPP